MRIPTSTIVGMTVAATLLTGCGIPFSDSGSGAEPSSQEPVSGDQVSVVDDDFTPANLEVEAGATVTWTWEGRAPHDVVGDDFDSGVLRDGTFTHTFDEPGTYDYTCTLHPGMDGRITVVEP
jgi:plastocyanin